MSRIVVVGMDGMNAPEGSVDLGPTRRTRQFTSALADAGHEVLVLRLADKAAADRAIAGCVGGPSSGTVDALAMSVKRFACGEGREQIRKFAPDAVVAATVHASSLAAQAVAGHVPLWVDVFGDAMAEAQAKAARDGNDLALARYWAALVSALERGDHFSAVSRAQAHSLVGQLGLAGRLTATSAGNELVSVIPCGAERLKAGTTSSPVDRRVPKDAFVVLFSGSFNTWCDAATMVTGAEAAMDNSADIHLVVTGGAVPGHDERTYDEFCRQVGASRHRGRIHVLGWIERSRLAGLYERVDVGLNIERSSYERALGAENRVIEWLFYGIPAVTTALSESGRELVERGLAFSVRQGDPEGLGRRLVELSRDRERVMRVGARCAEHAERACSYAATAAPLIEWCASPRRIDRGGERRLRVALASEPQALNGLLEAYLAEIPAHRLAYRSLRWVWRRFARPRRRGVGRET